jgi:hypothetical protein
LYNPKHSYYATKVASKFSLGPTQPPIECVPGYLSREIKWSRCEADHSPPPSAEVRNAWSYTPIPPYVFMAWYVVKHRDNFTFYVKIVLSLSFAYCVHVSKALLKD